MKMTTLGVVYDSGTSTLLQEYILREGKGLEEKTIGFARLYRTKDDGQFWLHERFYLNAGGNQDNALPLTETEARDWLRDRFGWWKRFNRLSERVFGDPPV